jgi:capsular polysaccharide biosynthesis protein
MEGPGLPQSIWRYKWLVGGLVVLGILIAFLLSAAQPTRYEGIVRIYLTAEEVAAGDTERTVMSHAQFVESPTVADRVIALTGNRLTRKEFEKRLKVEPAADANFITIRALDTTPENAAGLANAVDLAYRQILSEQRRAAANQTIAALEAVQARLASELTQIQQQRRANDSPAFQAEEQAKRREMEATANKIEETSADAAGSPPVLQDTAAVPDEPVQPKPLLAAAIGALVGLVIGVALAWLLAARRRVTREESAESQASVVDDLKTSVEVRHDDRVLSRTGPHQAASANGAIASQIQEPPEKVQQVAADDNRVRESAGQVVDSLDEDPDLLYDLADWLQSQHQNFPQITAERLRDRLLFERVAVLLKADEGLELAGCVGWHADGMKPVARDDAGILNKLGGNGTRQIGSTEHDDLRNAGLLGDEAQTVLVAPLEHDKVPFGVLLVGQDEADSQASNRANRYLDAIGSFARSVAPDMHAWLLLRKLREQLASHGKAHEPSSGPTVPATVAAGSGTAESELLAEGAEAATAESATGEAGTAESDLPAIESESQTAESGTAESGTAESETAESDLPAVESSTAESELPTIESEPANAESEAAELDSPTEESGAAESGAAESGAAESGAAESEADVPTVEPAAAESGAVEADLPTGEAGTADADLPTIESKPAAAEAGTAEADLPTGEAGTAEAGTADADLPTIESKPAAAEAGTAEADLPTAEAGTAEAGTAEADLPTIESEPVAVWPTYPASSEVPSTPKGSRPGQLISRVKTK